MPVRSTGPRDVSHGSMTKAHGSKHLIVGTLICWLVALGPSYFSENVVPLCSVLSIFVSFCSILWCAREKEKEKGTHPHFDVPVSTYPWVDAIALTQSLLLLSRRAS